MNRRSLRNQQESSRGVGGVLGEPVNAPGAPGSLSYLSGVVWTPQGPKSLEDVVEAAIQRALARYSVYVQTKPYKNYDVIPVTVPALTATPVDAGLNQKGRRTLVVLNTDIAGNALWLNKSDLVNINNGIPIAPNYGSYTVAMEEVVTHWVYCAAQTTAIAVWYA